MKDESSDAKAKVYSGLAAPGAHLTDPHLKAEFKVQGFRVYRVQGLGVCGVQGLRV